MLAFLNASMEGLPGRVVFAGVGVSLMAYGSNKMMAGLWRKFFPKKEKKPYVQKKLVE